MPVNCELTPWTQSVHSSRTVKVWLRDTALLSFTHRALLRLVTRTVLTLEDRQTGSGAFRVLFSSSFFFSIKDSSPICSVSVLCQCHSVHIHSSNAHTLAQHCMRAYSTPRWQLSEKRQRYTVRLHKAWSRSKLPFSVSLRISGHSYYLILYLYYMTYRLLQKPAAVAVAVAAVVVVVHSYQ